MARARVARSQQTGGAYWKIFRYIIILNQTHIQYCKIIVFFCDPVF